MSGAAASSAAADEVVASSPLSRSFDVRLNTREGKEECRMLVLRDEVPIELL